MAVEVLELESSPTRRFRAALVLAAVLLLAGAATGLVVAHRARADVFSPEEARHALGTSYPDRSAPRPLSAPPPEDTAAPWVAPPDCRTLLLRPWLPDAWPTGARSGAAMGAPGVDSYPSSEAFIFTMRSAADASRLFAEARSALASDSCHVAIVQPARAGAAFTVTVHQQHPDAGGDGRCSLLSYAATASPPQPGSPERVTAELLRVGNTITLLVQLSEDDVRIFAGSYLDKDAERPALVGLCRQLETIRAGG